VGLSISGRGQEGPEAVDGQPAHGHLLWGRGESLDVARDSRTYISNKRATRGLGLVPRVRGALRDGLATFFPSLLKQLLVLRARPQGGDRELALLHALVEPHREAIDVGAHRGLYSLYLERIVGPDRLHLFEPVPELHRYLRRLFPRAHVHSVALSDAPGESTLSVPVIQGRQFVSRATLQPDLEEVGATGRSQLPVVTRRLDDYLEDGTLHDVGFLKIDVEGHELQVLRGAQRLLRTSRPVLLVEIECRHHRFPVSRVHEWLHDVGYDLYFLNPAGTNLVAIREFSAERDQDPSAMGAGRYVNNFFCLPRGRVPRLLAQVRERLRHA